MIRPRKLINQWFRDPQRAILTILALILWNASGVAMAAISLNPGGAPIYWNSPFMHLMYVTPTYILITKGYPLFHWFFTGSF